MTRLMEEKLVQFIITIGVFFCSSIGHLGATEYFMFVGGNCGLKFADTFFPIVTYQPFRSRGEYCWNIVTGPTIMTIEIPKQLRGMEYNVEIINETNSGSVEYTTSRVTGKEFITIEHNFVLSGKFTFFLRAEGNQEHYIAHHSLYVVKDNY